MIAIKITLPVANTAYNVLERVQAAMTAGNLPNEQLSGRCTSITIQYITNSGHAYIVPYNGAYAETAGVPALYGYDFNNSGSYWDKNATINNLSLAEIWLGSDQADAEFAILAITA